MGRRAVLFLFLATATAQNRESARDALADADAFWRGATADIFSTAPEAVRRYYQVLNEFKAAHDELSMCEVYLRIGRIYHEVSDWTAELDTYQQAIRIPGLQSDVRLLIGIANAYAQMGDLQRDIAFLTRAFELARKSGKLDERAASIEALSAFYGLFDVGKAIDLLRQLPALRRAEGDDFGEIQALRGLANAHRVNHDYPAAVETYRTAIRTAAAKRPALQPVMLQQLSLVYLEFGKPQLAFETLEEERKLLARNGRTSFAVSAAEARSMADLQEPEKARAYLRETLDIAASVPEPDRLGAYFRAWELYSQLGNPAEALEYYRKSLPWRGKSWLDDSRAKFDLARIERDLGDKISSRKDVEVALEVLESVRATAGSSEIRASLAPLRQQEEEFYIDLLMDDGSKGAAAEALAANERHQARTLLESVMQGGGTMWKSADPELVARLRSLAARLSALSLRQQQLAGSGDKQAADRMANDAEHLIGQYNEASILLQAQSRQYREYRNPQIAAPADLQKLLDADTIIVEYHLGGTRSFAWTITAQAIAAVQLAPAKEIEAAARSFYESLTARGNRMASESAAARSRRIAAADRQCVKSGEALAQLILNPLRAQIHSKSRVVVVPDGALQYVPFAALPLETGEPMVTRYEIVSLPSASLMTLLRPRAQGVSLRRIALIGDPVFGPQDARVANSLGRSTPAPASANEVSRFLSEVRLANGGLLPRLPFTRRELNRIAEVVGPSKVLRLVDFAANRKNVESGTLGQFDVVHFATHGFFDTRMPELSGLVLSLVDRHGAPQDGYLRISDIAQLPLHARLVVLSACETALGKDIKGEGLLGVVHGFFEAGASSVVATLWQVDDAAASELMPEFYRGLINQRLGSGAALRRAQMLLHASPRYRAPYYWSGFVLQGEWQ
jgi:CHAT domain-containing protein